MLTLPANRGFSLIELMVAVAVFAILIFAALPGFMSWIQNTQIRTEAEAMQNGVQLARGEAVRTNTNVRFQLVDTLTNGCVLSTTGKNWVVSMDDPTSACATTPWDQVSAPPAVRILQWRSSIDGTRNAVVTASQSTIVFNGLGRVTPVPGANITIDITNPTGGTCATTSTPSPIHCLRIVVSTGGQVRMCDIAYPSTDPQGC